MGTSTARLPDHPSPYREQASTLQPFSPDAGRDARVLASVAAGVLLRAFEEIGDAWDLTGAQRAALIGGRSRTTHARWIADPDNAALDLMTRERIAHVIGIRVALASLFGTGEAADGWARRQNDEPSFGGRAPIEDMTCGTTGALADIRSDLQRRRHRR